MEKPDFDRGKVETISLKRRLIFNSNLITKAVVEIDHINYGLNKKTRKLNSKRRTNFAIFDIEKFLMLLDGEQLMATKYRGRISQFEVRIDCPVKGRFFEKEFILVFDTDCDRLDQIHAITLFPGW